MIEIENAINEVMQMQRDNQELAYPEIISRVARANQIDMAALMNACSREHIARIKKDE
jgi:hypothetical protein